MLSIYVVQWQQIKCKSVSFIQKRKRKNPFCFCASEIGMYVNVTN